MTRNMRKMVVVLALLVTASATFAANCHVPPKIKVRPSFFVQVLNQGKPVQGVAVLMTALPEGSNSAKVLRTSDANGKVTFASTKDGRYLIKTVPFETDNAAEVDVAAVARDTVDRLVVVWPNKLVITAPLVTGTLYSGLYQARGHSWTGKPLANTEVELMDALSGHSLGRVQTDGTGAFSFGAVRAGYYFLHVYAASKQQTSEPSGDVALQVKAGDNRTAPVKVYMSQTSCGLAYGSKTMLVP